MFGKKQTGVVSVLGTLLLALLGISSAHGSGFAIYTQDAQSLGQAAATIAHTEDPSAIFFNPALINKLDRTQTMLGTTVIFPTREFKSDLTGNTFKADSGAFFPSTFYVTHKFNDTVSAGLGVFNPFGLSTKWPDTWEGRFIATNSDLKTYNINPVASLQVAPWLSLAGGADFLFLDAKLEKKISFAPFGLPEGAQKFEGDGTGVGFNLGALIEPCRDVAIGASYRSKIRVNVDGHANFSLPPIASPVLSPLFPNTDGSTSIKLPQQAHFGIYYKGLYPFTFELAARWEGWSSFKRLEISLDQPVAGSNVFVTERDWKDTWSGSIGLKYQVTEAVALLAGYLYQGTPVPNATFDPSIPDAKGQLFTIGTDIKYKSARFGLAYGYQLMQNRNKNNAVDDNPDDGIINPATAANGKYKSHLHMVALNFTYTF